MANTCRKKTKCFACNETGHCPKVQRKPGPKENNDQTQQASKRPAVKRARHNIEHYVDVMDARMYCLGVLHGVGITALVDSGATATLITSSA